MVTQSFNERKRKKKGLLALLLLLLKSRKHMAVLAVVVMAFLSVAVTVPASTLYRIPGFSKFLSAIGLSSYSEDAAGKLSSASLLKLAMQKRAEKQALLSSAKRGDGSLSGTDRDAVAMVVGGKELWDRHATAEGAAKDAKREVRGVGGSGEAGGAAGEEGTDPVAVGDGVVNASLLGGGNEGGGFGEFGTYGTYGSQGNVRANGVYSSLSGARGMSAVESASRRVPSVIGGSFNQAKSSGRLAGFSWNNVNATRRAGGQYAIKGRGSRRAMKQLNDVYAASMAGSRNYAMETKSVYASAPFDGQDLKVDTIGEDTGESTPNSTPAFTQGQNVLDQVQAKSQACLDANETHGRKASQIGKEIDELSKQPPTSAPDDVYNCGEINAWNSKMSKMRELCNQYNTEASAVATACNSTYDNNPNCSSQYDPNALKCKKKPSKCAMIMMLLCVFLALVLVVVAIGLIVAAAILAAGMPMWVAIAAGVLTASLAAGVGIKALSGLWGISMGGMGSGLGGGMGGTDTSSGS